MAIGIGSGDAETFSGGAGNDEIRGLAGDDSLQGGAGDDQIQGGPGNDTLDGGAGPDLLSYLNAAGGVTVSLAVSGAQAVGGGEGSDRISGFEWLDGGLYGDRLTGDGQGNYIRGWSGDDTVDGGAGADTIEGRDGADSIVGGDGDDVLSGNGGRDVISAGGGADLIWLNPGDSGVSAGQMDVITDWSSQDRLMFGYVGGGGYLEGTALDYASATSLANYNIANGTARYVAMQLGSDVVVFGDSAGDGGSAEDVVVLQGRTLADISANNIAAFSPSSPITPNPIIAASGTLSPTPAPPTVPVTPTTPTTPSTPTTPTTPTTPVAPTTTPPPPVTPTAPAGPLTLPSTPAPPSSPISHVAGDLSARVSMNDITAYAVDATRGSIYMVSSGGGLQRYDIASKTYGPIIQLGGNLGSVAISPDGATLLAGDRETSVTSGPFAFNATYADTLYRVNLNTGGVERLQFAVTGQEGGIRDVAIAADGMALVTTTFAGSGWNTFHTFDADAANPIYKAVTGLPSVRMDSYLSASEDGRYVIVQEANSSDAPIHIYDAAAGRVTAEYDVYAMGRSGFNNGVGDVSWAAGLVVDVVGGAAFVLDRNMKPVVNLTNVYGGSFAGAEFSEDGRTLYLWQGAEGKILVLDTATWGLKDTLIVPGSPASLGAYSGALDLIGGDRILLVATNDGLKIIDLAPGAQPTTPTTPTVPTTPAAGPFIGTAEADTISGSTASDTVQGGAGTDYLRGGEGNDSISGGADFDDINGNQGDDTASGGDGGDWVVGGRDNDLLLGDGGADLVYGNLGDDSCNGGEGDDIVRGGQGNDHLLGGGGADYLSGDRGDDTVSGGAGADLFHSFAGAGIDRVLDFSALEGDRLQLDPGTTYRLVQDGANTVVDMGPGDQVILVGVTFATLPTGWIFVGST